MYSNSSFPTLAQLWQGLQNGEAGPLPAPEGGETDLQSQKSTMISVVCGDNAWPRSIDTRMVTVDQGGHGVWLPTLNGCGYNAVTRFLVDGMRPAADKFCGAEVASARQVTPSQADAVSKVQARLAE
ncbi:alpha/beta hydrolase [Amycolatopsis sp. NPDC005232]|uniref:alpha/beta hydrolase n=1 Tax=Amycolatopsis sp. NPDC005232 TaxID=3157027 RepID=UPI0033ACCEDB